MRRLTLCLALLTACAGGGSTDDTATGRDADGDGSPADVDCDDGDASVHPGAVEVCNGVDDDCADGPDDGLAFSDWYLDDDGDGHGAGEAVSTCDGAPADHVASHDDCDDANDARAPSLSEVCDGIDNDCANGPDDGLTFAVWYADGDGDGFGAGAAVSTCDGAPAGHVATDTDCDDDDEVRFPGNPEVCDDRDNDCANGPDDGLALSAWYPDTDHDDFGDAEAEAVLDCGAPTGFVADRTDCDDTDDAIHPRPWWDDLDGDGFGDEGGTSFVACVAPDGAATNRADCDDSDPHVFPDAPLDRCDGVDSDCDDVPDPEVAIASGTDLTAAVAAAADDAILCLASGTYAPVTVTGRRIVLDGAGSGTVITGTAGRSVSVAAGAAPGDLTLRNVRVSGASGVLVAGSTLTAEGVTVAGVSGTVDGVGLLARSGAVVNLTDVSFEGVVGTSSIEFGVVHLDGSTGTFHDVIVRDTTTSAQKGAAMAVLRSTLTADRLFLLSTNRPYASSTNGGAMWVYESTFTGSHVVIADTRTQGAAVGGALMEWASTVRLSNVIIAGTSVGSGATGGAIYAGMGTFQLTNASVVGTRVGGPGCSGAGMMNSSANTIVRNTVFEDNGGCEGESVIHKDGITTPAFAYSAFSDTHTLFAAMTSPVGTGGNVAVPAGFVDTSGDPMTWDLHLGADSDLRDAGDPALRDPDGSISDIGAYGGPGGAW